MFWRTASGPADGHRHHRHAGLDGDAERPGLELAHAPLFALIAGALGEDGEAVPAPDHRGGVLQGLHRPADVVPLDIDAAQQVHPPAEQGDAGQLLFGQDAVGAVEADQHQRDVEIAAVVAHKHHRAPGGDVLPPFHDQLDPGHPQQAAAPARDVAVHDPAQRLPVAGGQRFFAAAQHRVIQQHIPEHIDVHNDRPQDVQDLQTKLLPVCQVVSIVAQFAGKWEMETVFLQKHPARGLAKSAKCRYYVL